MWNNQYTSLQKLQNLFRYTKYNILQNLFRYTKYKNLQNYLQCQIINIQNSLQIYLLL